MVYLLVEYPFNHAKATGVKRLKLETSIQVLSLTHRLTRQEISNSSASISESHLHRLSFRLGDFHTVKEVILYDLREPFVLGHGSFQFSFGHKLLCSFYHV